MIKLLKQKMNIISTSNNNIFTHKGLVDCVPLHQHLRAAQYAEFIIRINSNDLDGISTRIIIRKTQLRLGLIDCIFTIDSAQTIALKWKNRYNFNFELLKEMKDQCFNFDNT